MNSQSNYLNYQVTYQKAVAELAKKNPIEVSWKSNTAFVEQESAFCISYFNQQYRVAFPSGEVKGPDGKEPALVDKIILLHYLINAQGIPLSRQWITFKELPGGSIYTEPFMKRAIHPFTTIFGNRPELFRQAAATLGGVEQSVGDIAMTIQVLPMVPLTFVLWLGDDEFLPSGNILFDASAPSYLPTEDYAVLPGLAVKRMKRYLEHDART
ncbi:DUF3786 domain-containing protein [Calderihabitans maritimus]|uniref:DUF3786 domain-containing protein n=1 Tax=Calderihabitans maritimus TaxID=1246530 RepID=A0A1Z5HY52_9FIRM|nr:DUF3786 domain-containing protein [Calderihabitans maritimus]GAW94271.1 hypothetical protein Tph_c14980 [Calderihabitans maritimus]